MKNIRVAWVYPMSGLAFYLQPVIREFTKSFPGTTLFTGEWPGFVPGCEDTFDVEVVGKTKLIKWNRNNTGYERGIYLLSLAITPKLLFFKPNIIFVNGLSLWTLITVALKGVAKWRITLIYSGSSPNVDMSDARFRLAFRRAIAKHLDCAVTNSQAGKEYLVNTLGMRAEHVFAQPYQMPDRHALEKPNEAAYSFCSQLQRPIFLFIGQTISRKGIDCLLTACQILNQTNEKNYSVLIIGDGEQRPALEQQTQTLGLNDQIKWLGWVEYGKLGSYFKQTDVFIFPTLEDIWGMVVLEAMLFGKPILCSKFAGVKEMMRPGENGFIFDPYQPKDMADCMKEFIQDPKLIERMSEKSRELIKPHNPQDIAKRLVQITNFAINL